MSISITLDKTQRISITVPTGVLEKVKHRIDDKSVSSFFAEAAAEKLVREERSQAFQALLAAPPTHTSVSDTHEYLRELRKEDAQRDDRLGL